MHKEGATIVTFANSAHKGRTDKGEKVMESMSEVL